MSEDNEDNPAPPAAPEAPKKFGPRPGFQKKVKPQNFGGVRVEPAPVTADANLTGELQDAIADQQAYERQEYAEEIERIRKVRKPFGASLQKLALPLRPNYHRHWFNDTPGRLEEAKVSGWTNVKDDQGKPIRRVVGSGRDKGALYAYAMEIPSVFWEEDQQANLLAAKARVDAIKSSPVQAPQGAVKSQDKEKFYTPREISIEKR